MVVLVLLAVALVGSEGRAGARLEVRLEVALAAEGLLAALALEGVHVHVEVICKEMGEQRYTQCCIADGHHRLLPWSHSAMSFKEFLRPLKSKSVSKASKI